MKGRAIPIAAAALIAVGALADHIITADLGSSGPAGVQALVNHQAAASPPVSTTVAVSNSQSLSYDQLVEHAYAVASRSVVYVDSVGTGTGSGIIYDGAGDIVTNAHVVSGATSLKVTLNDGRVFKAKLLGTDAADDLAVVHINATGLHPATFAQAGSYHVAQTVLAIGSPLGLKQSVTSGLISGLNRAEQEPSGAYLPNAIQTSAPINPGNSGGALVSLDGVVVGMPTLEQTGTNNGTSAQNIGFAVPSERIVYVANQIIATGKVEHTGRPYMGIAPADPGASVSPFGPDWQGGSASVEGAVAQQVAPTGPAAQAGIQQGDVITSVNGTPVTDAQDLLTILATKKPGDTISVKVDRNGSTLTMNIRLGELPA